jgi:hypothetical protein
MNDYSAPTAYGFRDVLVQGFVDEVAIICGASEIARHPRVYGRGQFVFDPKHYLALLEQKPGALDQAAPLQNWTLPEPLRHLRRLLEARMGNRGKREFIQTLRLMEVFPETLVAAAALDAIRLGAISFDAVKQPVLEATGKCLIPDFDAAVFSLEWKDALWARFFTGAPQRQRQCVERYNIVKVKRA